MSRDFQDGFERISEWARIPSVDFLQNTAQHLKIILNKIPEVVNVNQQTRDSVEGILLRRDMYVEIQNTYDLVGFVNKVVREANSKGLKLSDNILSKSTAQKWNIQGNGLITYGIQYASKVEKPTRIIVLFDTNNVMPLSNTQTIMKISFFKEK